MADTQTLNDCQEARISYGRFLLSDLIQFFIKDEGAREDSCIIISSNNYAGSTMYDASFVKNGNPNGVQVHGFTDEERSSISMDSVMTLELERALLASSERKWNLFLQSQ